ncbi:MAG: hypothetical protein P8O16_06940 [Algoriphagus sp.]|uniref:hypothetical protein n=1 Tax=Algoriphagus sp. TaxID=1872435 RepID=UPI0026074BBC|nr:hypothetical protein [Algoriphagus sp.]MDG1277000.1 hypothetical protein [Algoriphagus sp.]
MSLNATTKLPFGKYRGIELGIIYLFSPSYINWMLESTSYAIEDIDFLSSLKVINRFGNQGFVAHYADIDREELENYWIPDVNFEDIKYSGFRDFSFSKYALEKNEDRLATIGIARTRAVVPEDQREINIFYPSTGVEAKKVELKPLKYIKSSKGKTMVSFELNNLNNQINFLPSRSKLKVSSLFWENWKISESDLTSRMKQKSTVQGKISDGILILEK